jgi:Fis family transcriptional regulator
MMMQRQPIWPLKRKLIHYVIIKVKTMTQYDYIAQAIKTALTQYFEDLDGEIPCAIYDMVLSRVEKPLLEVALARVEGNQTKAAELLGLNRNTLRKKMKIHQLC